MKKKLTKKKISKKSAKRKILKRNVVKKKNPKPKEPWSWLDKEDDGINKLNIDMGDESYSGTQEDLENLKRNYWKCPNEFRDNVYGRLNQRSFISDDPKLQDRFLPLYHLVSYCNDSKCKTCKKIKIFEELKI